MKFGWNRMIDMRDHSFRNIAAEYNTTTMCVCGIYGLKEIGQAKPPAVGYTI